MPLSDYEVRAELSQGGKGVVLRGFDPRRLRPVLLLRLRAEDDQGLVRRFLREGEALERLRHPHVVEVFEVGQEQGGEAFLVCEAVGGESLQARLERDGPLPGPQAARAFLQLADAIDHAHAVGVLHRDLRPANVWIDRRGGVRVTHFGLVKDLTASDGTTYLARDGAFLGTLGYAAPEQVGDQPQEIGAAADVYGLGAVLYAMLSGQPPLQGSSQFELLVATQEQAPPPLTDLRADVPPFLAELCAWCLRKDPPSRPSVNGLVDRLAAWLGVARPEPPDGREPLLYRDSPPSLGQRFQGSVPDAPPYLDDYTEPGERLTDDTSCAAHLVVRRPLTPEQEAALVPVLCELRAIDVEEAQRLVQRAVIPVLEDKTEATRAAVSAQLAALGIPAQTTSRAPRAASLQPVCAACREPARDGDPVDLSCTVCARRFHEACLPASTCASCRES